MRKETGDKKQTSDVVSISFNGEEAQFLIRERARVRQETGLKVSLRQIAMRIIRGEMAARKGNP